MDQYNMYQDKLNPRKQGISKTLSFDGFLLFESSTYPIILDDPSAFHYKFNSGVRKSYSISKIGKYLGLINASKGPSKS